MTLYQIKLALMQLAYDIQSQDTWEEFSDNIRRYGINIFYDRVLIARFTNEIRTEMDDRIMFELFTVLFKRYSREEVIDLFKFTVHTNEYQFMHDDLANHSVVGL